MVIAIGDLHLSDSRAWSWEVSNRIVDFISNHPLNNPDNTGIMLGDVTEDAFLSGQVFFLMMKLFLNLRFKHTYVLVGNHDLKKNKQGQTTLSFEFLKHKMFKDKVSVISESLQFTEENINILALPWKPDMKEYGEMNTSCDLLVGHFQDTSIEMPNKSEAIDISSIKRKFTCLGHIHDKNHPNYIGSIVPNSIDGAGLPRYVRGYNKEKEVLVSIPHFMDYCFVRFPDPLPIVNVETPVWTIYNCREDATAKVHYGDIYIRKTVYDITMDKKAFAKLGQNMTDKTKISVKEMYGEWKKTAPYEPEIMKLADSYFEN